MCSIDHQMTEIYCFVDDFLKTHPSLAGWRHSPRSRPKFTDAEVITIALLQSSFGVDKLKRAYDLVAKNWRAAFPHLPTHTQWINRSHQLPIAIGALLSATCGAAASEPRLYLIDGKPIPLCHALRHGRVRLLREEGAYFGKSSKGWFFGFPVHAARHISGRVMNLILTPANWDDRAPALALMEGADGGITLGDLGYRGADCAALLADEAEMLLITRADAPDRKFLLSQVRQGIETMFSRWWHHFIDRVFSRSWHGLWNTIRLKVLHYNLVHAGILSV